jgi:hypothetical protein
MPDEIIMQDLTEPEPMQIVTGVENPYDPPYLWNVELYLMSKYYPEFVEATIFKVRAAALERAKIVKEHHYIIQSMAELTETIQNDLYQHVPSGRITPVVRNQVSRERSNFGQRELL